jgi:hypothetical protein
MRIPPDIREALPDWELATRCLHAASLYADASVQGAEAAEATRLKASRVLGALPVDQFLTRMAYFDTELQKASRAEDDQECGRIFAAICRLQWANIYPDEDVLSVIRPKIAEEMAYSSRAASRAAALPKARAR